MRDWETRFEEKTAGAGGTCVRSRRRWFRRVWAFELGRGCGARGGLEKQPPEAPVPNGAPTRAPRLAPRRSGTTEGLRWGRPTSEPTRQRWGGHRARRADKLDHRRDSLDWIGAGGREEKGTRHRLRGYPAVPARWVRVTRVRRFRRVWSVDGLGGGAGAWR